VKIESFFTLKTCCKLRISRLCRFLSG